MIDGAGADGGIIIEEGVRFGAVILVWPFRGTLGLSISECACYPFGVVRGNVGVGGCLQLIAVVALQLIGHHRRCG